MASTPVAIDPDLGTTAPVPSAKGNMFDRTFICCKCHLPFKESDTTTFQGKIYGIPCGCSNDIRQLAGGGK